MIHSSIAQHKATVLATPTAPEIRSSLDRFWLLEGLLARGPLSPTSKARWPLPYVFTTKAVGASIQTLFEESLRTFVHFSTRLFTQHTDQI